MSEILFTAPLAYETGNPITPPSEKGSRFRVDLVDGRIYQWDSGPDVWRLFAQGLDPLPNTSAPAYIPGIGQSTFAITTDRKLYFYSGGAWNLIPVQGATGPAGPNGAAGPAGPTGPQGVAGAAGQGVPVGGTAGQVLSKIDATNFNTAWAADKNGIYSGSGTIPDQTHAKLAGAFTSFWIDYNNNTPAIFIDPDGSGGIGINDPTGTNSLSISDGGVSCNTPGMGFNVGADGVTFVSTLAPMYPPRMTTVQRDAMVTVTQGGTIFNLTTSKTQTWNGSTWNDHW